MGKLADEKTLELNITHELLSSAGVGCFGFTQDEESKLSGGDVVFPYSIPLILQYKSPFDGTDNVVGKFYLNKNKNKNQHMMLHCWSQSGLCRAVYVFPLIISDNFLTANFGHLLDYSQAVDAEMLTGTLNWDEHHWIEMHQNCNFRVHSEIFKGKGFPAKNLIEHFNSDKSHIESNQPFSEYIPKLIEKMESDVKRAKIYGKSEHTLYIKATNKNRTKFGFLSLPILINGLERKYQ